MNSFREENLGIFNSIDFQKIIDHPNILIAARFWEEDRFKAAKICYRFMRVIDDMIDNHKAVNKVISPEEKAGFKREVNDWLQRMVLTSDNDPVHQELIETVREFRIPFWTMEAFARSMVWDIEYNGFPSLDSFLNYAKGASVAPASIFVHLAGLQKLNGSYTEPLFDVKEAAMPCAVFSYLVHIIRDFQKDQLNNLNYFPDEMILRHGLTREELKDIALGQPVNQNFRNLIGELHELAGVYREKTWRVIEEIKSLLEPRYRLSLEIIFSLYLLVYEKIKPESGHFTSEELNPTPEETRDRVLTTILNFSD
jgi:phytoene/squalene synthetase